MAASAIPAGRPKDSMKSTWRHDRSQWGPFHWIIHILNLHGYDLGKEVPVFQKTDSIPFLTQWSANFWILYHTLWPMMLHKAYIWYYGHNLSAVSAFSLYSLAMQLNSVHQIWALRRLGHKYGYLDGDKHARDEIPDQSLFKVFSSLELTTTVRPMLAIFFAYRKNEKPHLSWWLPVELGLYSIVLDFFFYIYHRSCHELDSLWKYHRTHHLTKHPNPTLSSYADPEQELLEIALIPLASWAVLRYVFGFPMSFYDWWLCHEYVIFSEAFGHSGVRVFAVASGTSNPVLELFGAELVTEDHDLHHRKGWRHSQNYGKQTRLWDKLFGTCGERIESPKSNVDWKRPVNMPLF